MEKKATQDDIVELIHTADRAFVEGTPEAMEELRELVEKRRKEYSLLRAVPRGAVSTVQKITHYGLFRTGIPESPMVKEADFYLAQREESLRTNPKDNWHLNWEPLYDCETIGQARRSIAARYNVKLSKAYSDKE
jgi:hypothetical protein